MRARSLSIAGLAASCVLFLLAAVAGGHEGEGDKQGGEHRHSIAERLKVPEGGVAELQKFIEGLKTLRPENAAEALELRRGLRGALVEAYRRILAQETDRTSPLYREASLVMLVDRAVQARSGTPEERAQVLQDSLAYLEQATTITRDDVSLGMNLGSMLERSGQAEEAVKAFQAFGERLSKSDDQDVAKYGRKMLGSARRAGLPGKVLELEGTLVDGAAFNLTAYRGKVVLVDFWATWCGPCVAELPNVKANYEKYHAQGFEVVGVSLDSDRERLESFLQDQTIPWVNLFQDGAGWDHPAATHYGIMSIPSTLLVDREGKVVSMHARGEELAIQLKQLMTAANTTSGE